MAHSCPTCDQYCTCGGDIDDMQLDGTTDQANCYHCACDDDLGEELDDDYIQGTLDAMFCTRCQALEWFDCYCNEHQKI